MSGVTPLAAMMKPFNCPGECIYCPLELNMPKSYLSDEPAAQRAKKLNFDARAQISQRLEQLKMNGHPTDKLEIIVVGGTYSAYPTDYKIWFIGEIYRAANETKRPLPLLPQLPHPTPPLDKGREKRERCEWEEKVLAEIKINETAKQRIVALSVETRPDWVTEAEVRLLRRLGVTKVQLGVQAIDEEISRITKRGHGQAEVAEATRLLRNAGMKICYHIMPNLPGSDPKKDVEMAKLIYTDPRFMPDYVKLYPCMVIKGTALYRLWQKGQFKTYDDETLKKVLKEISAITPEWVRVDRLIRDISKGWVGAGSVKTNMRQEVERELIAEGRPCRCIRCREIGAGSYEDTNLEFKAIELATIGGREVFFSYENEHKLFALLRLRLPDPSEKMLFPELKEAAIVREVHSYGQAVPLSTRREGKSQHQGLGRLLMEKAEEEAVKNGYKKLAVIAAVGTREYYKKLGYVLEGLYMVKTF